MDGRNQGSAGGFRIHAACTVWYAAPVDSEDRNMAAVQLPQQETSEAAIFARLWESREGVLSPELARQVLKRGFSELDQARMHELAAKNQAGTLTAAESDALHNYVKVGDLLAILQSKARKRLKVINKNVP
jgi:hypothetical protein